MPNTTFIASNDFSIITESGDVEFKKGSIVCLEVDDNDDPYISYHEEAKDGSIHEFEIDITTKEIFESILDNVSVLGEEYGDVEYLELPIADLLESESISLDVLTCYLAEVAKKKVIRKGTMVKVPVRKRKVRRTAKQKASLKMAQRAARKSGAKKARAKSMKIRKRKIGESVDYLVESNMLIDVSDKDLAKYTKSVLDSYFGEHVTVRVTKEGKLNVNLKEQEFTSLIEALERAGVHYIVEGKGQHRIVSFVRPEEKPVVESYFTEVSKSKKKEMDDEDMDDEDMDDDMEDDELEEKKKKKKESDDEEMEEEDDELEEKKKKKKKESDDEEMEEEDDMEDDELEEKKKKKKKESDDEEMEEEDDELEEKKKKKKESRGKLEGRASLSDLLKAGGNTIEGEKLSNQEREMMLNLYNMMDINNKKKFDSMKPSQAKKFVLNILNGLK